MRDLGRVTSKIPLTRRLGFRIAALLFLGLLMVDLLTLPFWNWLYYELAPEWSDPEMLRAYADQLEWMTPEEIADEQWKSLLVEPSDGAVVVAATAAYASVFALALGSLVSFVATRRISRLTNQAARSPAEEGVPGPFDAAGSDEIAVLGRTMNTMRVEILSLLADIEGRDRDRRKWVAEVSHDLRTPLTALAVTLDQAKHSLRDDGAAVDRDSLKDFLTSARHDVQRVQDLAEDLLEIARLDAGEVLAEEPVPPGELLRDTVRELGPVAEKRGVRLVLELASGLPELQADGRRLLRALENLVLNSVQHARSEVRVTAAVQGDALRIEIRDDGPGLPETDGEIVLEELGQRLARPDSVGIGLEVAQKVVGAHGGQLTAANDPEGGARIAMQLPVAARTGRD